jgi:voltage-gated potassium channel
MVLASNRRDFFLHHLLDLVIIVVPVFRPLRLLRVLRSITVLARSASRLRHALSHHGVHYMLLLAIVSLFSGAGLELYFERHSSGATMHSYGDVLWWALATMTTSSGGNFYPVTAAGRGIALVLVLVGLSTFGLMTASIASFFVEERAEPTDELTALRSEIAEVKVLVRELVDQGHYSKDQLAR